MELDVFVATLVVGIYTVEYLAKFYQEAIALQYSIFIIRRLLPRKRGTLGKIPQPKSKFLCQELLLFCGKLCSLISLD
jgi:hypothetical protein